MKVLELFSTFKVGKTFFPGAELDVRKMAYDLSDIKDETYDHLVAAHVMQHFIYSYSQVILIEYARVVKPGGSVIILTPSLEWVAEQILSEKPSPATMAILFGTCENEREETVNFSGYTIRALRKLFDGAGLRVTHARTGLFDFVYNDKKEEVEQHLLIGKKEGKNGEEMDSESNQETGRTPQTTGHKSRKKHSRKNPVKSNQEGRQVGKARSSGIDVKEAA